jgi:hypothetical protein
MIDIITLLDQLEEVFSTTPTMRTQREFDKLKNIASVNRPEAIATGLAQCCAYARLMQETAPNNEGFVHLIGNLTRIMAISCGVDLETRISNE